MLTAVSEPAVSVNGVFCVWVLIGHEVRRREEEKDARGWKSEDEQVIVSGCSRRVTARTTCEKNKDKQMHKFELVFEPIQLLSFFRRFQIWHLHFTA